MALVPCKTCRRAFRSTERGCPFCRTTAKIAAGAIAGAATIFSSIGCVYGCPGGCEPHDAGGNDVQNDVVAFDVSADVAQEASMMDAEPDVTQTDAGDAAADSD